MTGPAAESRPATWRIAVAIALPLLVVVAVIVLARQVRSAATDPATPLAVSVVFQPAAGLAECAAVDAALPDDLDGAAKRTLVVSEAGVAAWGDPPRVYRCGISDPEELTCTAALSQFNGVAWLPLTGPGSTTYVAVDRPVRIALTLDDSVGVGAVQAMSNVIKTVLPAQPVCTNGVLTPTRTP